MAIKKSKRQKQTSTKVSPQQRTAQIAFAIFALILILSMVLTAIAKF